MWNFRRCMWGIVLILGSPSKVLLNYPTYTYTHMHECTLTNTHAHASTPLYSQALPLNPFWRWRPKETSSCKTSSCRAISLFFYPKRINPVEINCWNLCLHLTHPQPGAPTSMAGSSSDGIVPTKAQNLRLKLDLPVALCFLRPPAFVLDLSFYSVVVNHSLSVLLTINTTPCQQN